MKITIYQNNGEKLIQISNPISKESIEINASIGGTLTSMQLSNGLTTQELISVPYQQKYTLNKNPFYPSGLLMPWVNRIRNGNYSFKGKNYQLPINELNLGNAIHGFMAHANFEIIETKENENEGFVTLESIYDGLFPGFPFPFVCQLCYSLDKSGTLSFQIIGKNCGEKPMPFATGWHPYFQLGNNLEDLTLYFNSKEKFLSDSQMIPLKSVAFLAQKGMPLHLEKPDNVFLLEKSKSNSVALLNDKSGLQLNLEFNSETFPYFVAFCPEGENCIALEPMTANTDCFNTNEGLLELDAQEEFHGSIKIYLSKIGQN